MQKTLLMITILWACYSPSSLFAAQITLPDAGGGSTSFDTTHFVDVANILDGSVTNPNDALGVDLDVFASVGNPATLELEFTDNDVNNNPGTDLWIYEIGFPETFNLTIGGTTQLIVPVDTLVNNSDGDDIYVAQIEFGDFGFASGPIGTQTIMISNTTNSTPDIAAVAVPEPATMVHMALLGAIVLFCRRWRR